MVHDCPLGVSCSSLVKLDRLDIACWIFDSPRYSAALFCCPSALKGRGLLAQIFP